MKTNEVTNKGVVETPTDVEKQESTHEGRTWRKWLPGASKDDSSAKSRSLSMFSTKPYSSSSQPAVDSHSTSLAAKKGTEGDSRGARAMASKTKESDEPQLHIAARKGDLSKVKKLLKQGASLHASGDGVTVLHVAAKVGNLDIVKFLLGQGADRDAKDKNFEDCYDYAQNEMQYHITEYLEDWDDEQLCNGLLEDEDGVELAAALQEVKLEEKKALKDLCV